jgi:hypothetical protein
MSILRWFARLSALVIAAGFVAMVAGEMSSSQSTPPKQLIEWTGIILLSTACAGMLIAWRWELPGAVLSLASLVAFALTIRMNRHTVLFVMAIPGILFAIDSLWGRRLHLPTPQ